MSKERGFLEAIVSEPDEDSHRLVYADWLEENGNPERAEFIRAQCELATLEKDSMHRRQLAFRSRELLEAHEEEWIGWLREHPGVVCEFHRGFIERIMIEDDELYDLREKLFAELPLRRLNITEMTDATFLLHKVIPADHNLTTLNLNGSFEGDIRHLPPIPQLRKLKRLGLMVSYLEDEDAQYLCKEDFFRNLDLIRLGGNCFTETVRQKLMSHFGDRVSFQLERDEDCLYPLNGKKFVTGYGDHWTQLLLWPTKMAVFDHAGNLLETRYRDDPDETCAEWKVEFGFQPRPIRVKRFRFRDGTGIRDFPWWWDPPHDVEYGAPGAGGGDGLDPKEWIESGDFEYNNGDGDFEFYSDRKVM